MKLKVQKFVQSTVFGFINKVGSKSLFWINNSELLEGIELSIIIDSEYFRNSDDPPLYFFKNSFQKEKTFFANSQENNEY